MFKKIFIFIFLITTTLPVMAWGGLKLDPNKGIVDVISFGDELKIEKMIDTLGTIVKVDRPGLNSDKVDIKAYHFSRGISCITANEKVVQIEINSDNVSLDTGIKLGDDMTDITDQYGKMFLSEGNPKYGRGIMIYNIYPDHIITFTINYEGKCVGIMVADCALIYTLSPSNSILKYWDTPVDLKPSQVQEKIKVLKSSSSVDGKYMIIKGEILNNTDKEIRYVQIAATIYDAKGQVVDAVEAYIPEVHLKSGEISPFTVISTQGKIASKYDLKVITQ